ncbi:hypothetical protein C9374_010062 [Naegleria lovaniensis]|uniref:PH domain-containing protein n=1 Tax=Naegleria lovaniensis TaxID=51637 RepID=A0AA88GHN6_NAELO|nr:uncharacterized protein C9374_010062 [Naegleria lovaniensis]KAG2375058.1 hypothetical protein C9374_010062 [Naegleria lovaniensis]
MKALFSKAHKSGADKKNEAPSTPPKNPSASTNTSNSPSSSIPITPTLATASVTSSPSSSPIRTPTNSMFPSVSEASSSPQQKTQSPLWKKLFQPEQTGTTSKRKDSFSSKHGLSPSALSTKDVFHFDFVEDGHAHSPRSSKNSNTIIQRHTNMDPSTTTPKDSIFNKYDYDEYGMVMDPMTCLMDKDDVFILSSKFGRIKSVGGANNQTPSQTLIEDCILIIGKLNIYRIEKDSSQTVELSEYEKEVEQEIMNNTKNLMKLAREEEMKRLGLSVDQQLPAELASDPILGNNGPKLLLQTDITEPVEDVNFRSKWFVKWKVPWCMINSILSGEHDRVFTISFHKSASPTGFKLKDFQCCTKADKDIWVNVLTSLLKEYNQEYFETLIVPSPEVYQSHLYMQKNDSQKRAVVLSNKKLYNVKMAIGETDEKKIKHRFSVPLEYIKCVKSFTKTPNGIEIVFDKKKASKDKNCKGSLSEQYSFVTDTEETKIQFLSELAQVYFFHTNQDLAYEMVDGSMSMK